ESSCVARNFFIVNRFGKIVFVLAFFAAAFVLNLPAETVVATPPVEGAVEHAATEAAGPLVPMAAPTLFNIFGLTWLPVTNSMICTWIVAALIIVIVRLTTWRMTEVPGRGQNVMEAL